MHPQLNSYLEMQKSFIKMKKNVQVLNLLDLKIILHEDNSVETDMHNFKVQHQTPRQVKILFCLLQPIILISTTNRQCKQ